MLSFISSLWDHIPKETHSEMLRLSCTRNWLDSALGNTPVRERKRQDGVAGGIEPGLSCSRDPSWFWGSTETEVALQRCSKMRQVGWDFAPPPGPGVACGLLPGRWLPLAEGSFQGGAVSWAAGTHAPVLGPGGELDGRPQHLLHLFTCTVMLRFMMMEIKA